ncbi:MAG: histidine--tRNA ligase [Candidatus Aenigmatarchaeota archaeon]|nr:histidine--tRNA ligase [Candidatus Aenigmarchaeota archaeon]
MKQFLPVKGMKDFLQDEANILLSMIETIRKIFEKYGFVPLITPALESFELLSAKGGLGEAVKDEIYYFKDKSEREVGLRFDLTMPLARIISNNLNLPMPFKRYAIDRAWRYDNPQAMRYREFWQADIDIIGCKSLNADIECLCAVIEVFETFQIDDFKIKVNNRKVIQNILKNLGVEEENLDKVLKIIDKKDKIGIDAFKKEIENISEKININKIIEILTMKSSFYEKIKYIENEFQNVDGLEEIKELFLLAKDFSILDRLELDFSIVRGLDYYTSLVYEISVSDKNVSIGGGGRYDNLIKNIGGPDYPATGISIGLSRLFSLLLERGLIKKSAPAKIFVAIVNENIKSQAIKIINQLRAAGIRTDWDISERKLSKQIEYASTLGIPYVAIIGENELKLSSIKVRNMQSGEEILMPLGSFIAWARQN